MTKQWHREKKKGRDHEGARISQSEHSWKKGLYPGGAKKGTDKRQERILLLYGHQNLNILCPTLVLAFTKWHVENCEDPEASNSHDESDRKKVLQSEMKGIGLFSLKEKEVKGWQWLYSNIGRVLEGHWSPLLHVQRRLTRSNSLPQKAGEFSWLEGRTYGKAG